MANLDEAFVLPVHRANCQFATHPYVPLRLIPQKGKKSQTPPTSLTTARCFDLKIGAQCPTRVGSKIVPLYRKK